MSVCNRAGFASLFFFFLFFLFLFAFFFFLCSLFQTHRFINVRLQHMIMFSRRRIVDIGDSIQRATHYDARLNRHIDANHRSQLIVQNMRRIGIDHIGVRDLGQRRRVLAMVLFLLFVRAVPLLRVDIHPPHHHRFIVRASHQNRAMFLHIFIQRQTRHNVIVFMYTLMQLRFINIPNHKRIILKATGKRILSVFGGGKAQVSVRDLGAKVGLTDFVLLLLFAKLHHLGNRGVLLFLYRQFALLPFMHINATITANHNHLLIQPRDVHYTNISGICQVLFAIIFHRTCFKNRGEHFRSFQSARMWFGKQLQRRLSKLVNLRQNGSSLRRILNLIDIHFAFIRIRMEHIVGFHCVCTALLVSKDQIDPFVQVIGDILRLQRLTHHFHKLLR
mmetsp:Transcript_7035/g.11614  ORF Transcript_7035/g.11614 Transcript_7035/m.11614 type:complete len:390 (+) Transcript_7035:891-2060(+)